MKFSCKKEELMNAISIAKSNCQSRNVIASLKSLRFDLVGDLLTIMGSTLDSEAIVKLNVSGVDDGSICVDGDNIASLVRSQPKGTLITISVEDLVLKLTTDDGFEAEISGFDVDEFPNSENIDAKVKFELNKSQLLTLMQVSECTSVDQARLNLNGINCTINDDNICFVATDGHKLSKRSIKVDGLCDNFTSILAKSQLLNLVKVMSQDSIVKVGLGEVWSTYELDSVKFNCKNIEGPYPKYENVIPKNSKNSCTIDTVSLIDAVNRVNSISTKTKQIRLDVTSDKVKVMTRNVDAGANTEIEVECEASDDTSIGFNGNLLIEMAKRVSSESIKMDFNGELGAMTVESDNGVDLLMPLRMK